MLMIKQVGIIGRRGLVGRVLLRRMIEENDFIHFEPHFFSTSQKGLRVQVHTLGEFILKDAHSIAELKVMDIILSVQGSHWTAKYLKQLRSSHWKGQFIDAASHLRMEKNSIIVLDPVNLTHIKEALSNKMNHFIGGNCTVSLLMMAVGGLFKEDWIEWVSTMTYQAASGAGAEAMIALVKQMHRYGQESGKNEDLTMTDILDLHRIPHDREHLAGSLLPWIDTKRPNEEQTKEEWKGHHEGNKILGREKNPIPIDGTCVRVGVLRSHSQGLTIKLKKNIPLCEIKEILLKQNQFIKYIENDREKTIGSLTPHSVSGTLNIHIGRVRKMILGDRYLNIFTVGDQLLWGAAEPLRRMLKILISQ